MGEFRLDRLGEQIREEISKLLLAGKIKDPRVSTFLTIHRVDVSGDLGYAKVYVSSFLKPNEIRQGVKGLESASGFIQSTIGKKLRIRQFPKLTFIYDESIKEGFDMIQKINTLSHTVTEDTISIDGDDNLESD